MVTPASFFLTTAGSLLDRQGCPAYVPLARLPPHTTSSIHWVAQQPTILLQTPFTWLETGVPLRLPSVLLLRSAFESYMGYFAIKGAPGPRINLNTSQPALASKLGKPKQANMSNLEHTRSSGKKLQAQCTTFFHLTGLFHGIEPAHSVRPFVKKVLCHLQNWFAFPLFK